MLTRSMKLALMGDYYDYENDFEADAALSSNSFLTPLIDNRPQSRVDQEQDDRNLRNKKR